jgi:hypothetical protein
LIESFDYYKTVDGAAQVVLDFGMGKNYTIAARIQTNLKKV